MGKRRTIIKAMKPITRLLISTAAGLAVQNILNTKFNSDVLKRYKSESTESIFRNIKISAGDLVDDSKVHAHVGNIVGFGVSLGTFTVLGGGKEIIDIVKESVEIDNSNIKIPLAEEMKYIDFPCICNGRIVFNEMEYYNAENHIDGNDEDDEYPKWVEGELIYCEADDEND